MNDSRDPGRKAPAFFGVSMFVAAVVMLGGLFGGLVGFWHADPAGAGVSLLAAGVVAGMVIHGYLRH